MKKLAKTGPHGRVGIGINQDQAGFTLLELLIVISIMSMLTLIAVSSYTGVQRQARIDFSADSLVSAVKEQQLLARSGKVVGGGGAWKQQCYAIKFISKDGGSGLWTAKTNYQAVPASGGGGAGDNVDVCLPVAEAAWQKRDIFDGGIILKKLEVVDAVVGLNGNEVVSGGEEVLLYYKPPFGQVYLGGSEGGFKSTNSLKKGVMKMTIGIGNSDLDDKLVEYNFSSQEIKKVFKSSTP